MTPETRRALRYSLSETARDGERWLRRADLQLAFAHALAAALPAAQTKGWGERIGRAEAMLADPVLAAARPSGLEAAVRAMEDELLPIGQAAKTYTLYCVGHGHIDMNWMWSWPETVSATHDTFASVLSLMRQFPDLTYSQSQASVYVIAERYFPAMFTEIQQRVREGRWEVTAAHWVEGDKNIASGESLCRHLLHARRFCQDKFGLSPEDVPVDWEPDTFGHALSIPTFLAQGAVKYYYSCRQGSGFGHARIGEARPPLFWWEAPDGSRVLVNRETTWYNSYVNIGENIALPLAEFVKQTGLHHWLNVYGIGNHGGGPTRLEIDFYHELQDYPVYPKIVFSTATTYFRAIEAELAAGPGDRLPVIAHELNFEFTGCYTSQSLIKQANRFGENFLEEAETLAVLAARLGGQAPPKAALREAWLSVLFNQFHDILPGSGVRQTREHATALFQEVAAATGAIKRTAGLTLAGRLNTLALLPDSPAGRQERALVKAGTANTPFVAGAGVDAGVSGFSAAAGGGRRFCPFVIYNPCAWPRSERVMASLYDTEMDPTEVVARDETGRSLPTLPLGIRNEWGHSRSVFAFDALDVPALGYRTFLLCEGEATPEATPGAASLPDDWYETPALKFRLDRVRGGLSDLIDKRTGANIVLPGTTLGGWSFVTERPVGMSAWVLGQEVEPAVPLHATAMGILGAAYNEGTGAIQVGSAAGFRVTWHLAVPGTKSTVTASLMIHALEPRLDFSADVNWREIGDPERGIPGLVLRFPLALQGAALRCEAPFGSIERTLNAGEEQPSLRYAHVSGTVPGDEASVGITLLQDCKYGHSLHGSELRLRVVRSSYDPDPMPEVAQTTVRYSLVLHNSLPDPAVLARLGAAWNHPLLVLPANLQAGEAPAREGFARVLTPSVVLSALKPAEDGDGLVLRLVEMNGLDVEAEVELHSSLIAGGSQATVLDLMERPAGGQALLDGNILRVPIKAHSFVSVGLA